jgi:phytoene dehydrogenase-like protein
MNSDVVVIGAGVGGLAAAIRLAKAGFRVRVVEARSGAGGLASGVTFEGLSFDAGPYILLDRPGLEWSFEKLGLDLSRSLPLLPVDDVYQVEATEGTCVRFYSDLDKTAAGFNNQWPGSGERYHKFVTRMGRLANALRPMLEVSRPSPSKLVRSGGLRHALFLLRSLKSVLDTAELPKPVTDALAIWTHVAGQTPAEAPSPLAFVPALMHSIGANYPQGGMRRIPLVLEKAASEAGVRFDYSTRVRRICCEERRISGVETTAGELHPTSAIVANCAALTTYLELLETPATNAASLRQLPLQSPGVCAYLAVKGRGSPPYLKFKLGKPGERCRLLIQPQIVEDTGQSEWTAVRLLGPMDYGEAQTIGQNGQVEYLKQVLNEEWWQKDFSDVRVLCHRVPQQWGDEYNLYKNSMNPVMTARFMRQGRFAHRSADARGLYLAGSSTHPGQWVSFCMISGILAADCLIEDRN